VAVDVVDKPRRGHLFIEDLFFQRFRQACEWKTYGLTELL
jgi:hypothetical protein